MEKFDLFQPILEKAKTLGPYKVLAFEGDITDWHHHGSRWSNGDNPYTLSIKSRKSESERMTKGMLLVYDTETQSLIFKSLYRNTKGVYIRHKTKGAIYFIKELVPIHLK